MLKIIFFLLASSASIPKSHADEIRCSSLKLKNNDYSAVDVNFRDVSGNTRLHLAVLAKNRNLIQCLLEEGHNPNAQNKLGNTPLHLAANNEDRDSIQLLIARGADPDISNREGETALDWAILKENVGDIQLLFDRMIRIKVRNSCFVEGSVEKNMRIFQIFVIPEEQF